MIFFKRLLVLLFVFTFGCSEENNCVERITVPDNVIKTNLDYTFVPSYWVDLPCDYDLEDLLDVSTVLKNFSYEVISYNFSLNTVNNTYKIDFIVELKNNNNFDVEGAPIFLMRINGIESNTSYTGNNGNCNTINANETCTFSYTKEVSLEKENINSLELVSIKYLLIK